MLRDLATWQRVVGDDRLIECASAVSAAEVASVAALRKHYAADEVAVALELCRARLKAVAKFGERGRSMVADVQGIEQASGAVVGAYKAQRFCDVLGQGAAVVDACCGIGGDTMAFAANGLAVLAIDRDPLRAWMARHNGGAARVDSVCQDVSEMKLGDSPVHIDPARRDESAKRRAWRLEDYQPAPSVISQMVEGASAAAVKLSPGVDLDELTWPGEIEFISERGRLVQAVLWAGALAGDRSRSATLIDREGGIHTLRGEPGMPRPTPVMRYLYAVDPAAERAQLLCRLAEQCGAPAIHPRLGLLTSDRVIDSPWLTGFKLIERMPWRPKRVRQWLAGNDGGLIEIKTRGKACDPDREQQRLRGDGSTVYTVFVLRFDTKVEALVARRLSCS